MRLPCRLHGPAASERLAWYVYDWSNSAFVTSALVMFAPIVYSNLFGPSFFSYYVSMSVIAQCIVFIAVSAFADYGSGRKLFFIGFSLVGCVCTALMACISSSSDKALAAALLILANVCYGASFVFYNAYIPFLAQEHEDVVAADAPNKSVHQHQPRVSREMSRSFAGGTA
jgi:UMF1 family MFS transporter